MQVGRTGTQTICALTGFLGRAPLVRLAARDRGIEGDPGLALCRALAGSGSAGAGCGRRERHDPPAGLPRLGPSIVLADDEQPRVRPAAERAGEGTAIQVNCGQHRTALAHADTVLVADVGVPDGTLGIHADPVRVI